MHFANVRGHGLKFQKTRHAKDRILELTLDTESKKAYEGIHYQVTPFQNIYKQGQDSGVQKYNIYESYNIICHDWENCWVKQISVFINEPVKSENTSPNMQGTKKICFATFSAAH